MAQLLQLVVMPDDCLLEIFASLSLMDLCSVAGTCKRLRDIVNRMFSRGVRIQRFTADYIVRWKNHLSDHNRQEIEQILRRFGVHLTELCVANDLALVRLVAKYCKDVTLTSIELMEFNGLDDVRIPLTSIIQRVSQLAVRQCRLERLRMNCKIRWLNWKCGIVMEVRMCFVVIFPICND